jgi:hypothetical protein
VSVECDSEQHQTIKAVAWTAIVMWPIGATLAALVLSFFAHADRVFKNGELSRPALRSAISFLHLDYKPEYWFWEPLPSACAPNTKRETAHAHF